jgi:hypothetical protein
MPMRPNKPCAPSRLRAATARIFDVSSAALASCSGGSARASTASARPPANAAAMRRGGNEGLPQGRTAWRRVLVGTVGARGRVDRSAPLPRVWGSAGRRTYARAPGTRVVVPAGGRKEKPHGVCRAAKVRTRGPIPPKTDCVYVRERQTSVRSGRSSFSVAQSDIARCRSSLLNVTFERVLSTMPSPSWSYQARASSSASILPSLLTS